jgi:hypothetical protein
MPDMVTFGSSNVEAVGYDDATQELHVRFARSGETYVYTNVEQWRFDELLRADSKGGYINGEIKPSYNFYKL